ncbi:hypothetical protein V22_17250 [Calycomorphotria hydatis]|uniref:Prenyltransferase and squalene oxidase repeat protein n=2 Tax=Calycomorphotria hydatis TaxID=2528027 RepID=A0A517T7Z3_9PLAN|nr:hypothetical protein V22_17250 [Calycomorphotria hydatis]
MQRLGRLLLMMGLLVGLSSSASAKLDTRTAAAVQRGLDYLARNQTKQGYWTANQGQYRVAMTALAGNAMLAGGSTTTQGRYADNIRRAVNYLVSMSQPNGLIGFKDDYHYTYGHGFSMLFLSQVFGEEEDEERRLELKKVLIKAVDFTKNAQTTRGGWGYVSAKDGNDFDEGSTCITQVQGLRACRNAGIPVPADVIERAVKYIEDCMTPEGGVQYSIRGGGARPAISGAAITCLFNSGEQEKPMAKKLLDYCKKNIWPGKGSGSVYSGHWHYMHYYYSQVMYRDEDDWPKYIKKIGTELLNQQTRGGPDDGGWMQGHIGPVYVTSINTTILQLDNGFLPIYQR